MRLRSKSVRSGIGNGFLLLSNNGNSLCMEDLLSLGRIHLKSLRQGEQSKNPNRCNSSEVSWASKRSTERAVYLHFPKQFKERKVSLVDQLTNLESRVNLVGCFLGSVVGLVVWVLLVQ
jgi:hypothetical protein